MSVAATSRLAFLETANEREIQTKVLLSLYRVKGALSDREACYLLGWEAPSVVSARRNGLLKSGLVFEVGKKRAETGKLVSVWGVGDGKLPI